MSNLVFTLPAGQAWSVFKTPKFSTILQTSTSGKEVRAATWVNPTWTYKLSSDFVRDLNAVPADIDVLMDFFMSRRGSYDSFLYTDPTDNSYTGQLVGYGDGATTTFQLARLLGSGFYEAVQNPQALTALYLGGSSLAAMANPVPATPAAGLYAITGPAGAGFFQCTWVLTSGESVPSAEVHVANITPNFLVVITQPANPPPDAIGWNVYGSGLSGTEHLQTVPYLPISQAQWFMPSSSFVTGLRVPPTAANNWQLGMENLLLWSQDFTNAVWAAGSCTVTGNAAVAPDGTTTAQKLISSNTPNAMDLLQAVAGVVPGDKITLSCWVQQGTVGLTAGVAFDYYAANGALIKSTLGTIVALTSSWQRIAVTDTVPLGAATVKAELDIRNISANGQFALAWGAQLERGIIPTGYLTTTTLARQPNGVINFTTAPALGGVITADYSFYFRLRFKNDLQEFEQFVYNLWRLQTLEMVSVKL